MGEHLAADVLPGMASRQTPSSEPAAEFDVLSGEMATTIRRGLDGLAGSGMRVEWNVEEVRTCRFDGLAYIVGAHRECLPSCEIRSIPYFMGSSVFYAFDSDQEVPASILKLWLDSGGTIIAKAVVTGKQTVVLRDESSNDILASCFDESARHMVSLSANLLPSAGGADIDSSHMGLSSRFPQFDERA